VWDYPQIKLATLEGEKLVAIGGRKSTRRP
jgi:hypothetical protein